MPRKVKPSGAEQRREKREVAIKKAEKTALEQINLEGFVGSKITSVSLYEEALAVLTCSFEANSDGKPEFIAKMRVLQKRSQEIIQKNKLLVSLPQVPDRQLAPKQVRDKNWFLKAREVHKWVNAFWLKLEVPDLSKLSGEELIGLILFSAMTRGGLINDNFLVQLGKVLASRSFKVHLIDKTPVLYLAVPVKKGSCNYFQSGEAFHREVWFVDPISFLLITKFMQNSEHSNCNSNIGQSSKCFFSLVTKVLFGRTIKTDRIKSLRDLCSVALWPMESLEHLKVSEALQNMASGHFLNFALSKGCWESFTKSGASRASADTTLVQVQSDSVLKPSFKISGPCELRDFLEGLKEVMKEKKRDGTKVTLQGMHKGLLALRQKHHDQPSSLLLLLDFYIFLSGKSYSQLRAPGSLRQYHYKLTSSWVSEFYDRDLDFMNEESFAEVYDEIIAHKETEKGQLDCKAYIKRLHQFGMRNKLYSLPWLPDWDALEGKSAVGRVRAEVIDHTQKRLAENFLADGLINKDEAEVLIQILRLGFRLGLRIGEILKIQLHDIDYKVLYVRPNRYGGNKSPSARRKLDLTGTFPPNEYRSLCDFVSRKRAMSGGAALLFTTEAGVPYEKSYISSVIGNALKNATCNPDIVFHSLRHSAANMFHAVIESDWELADKLGGFDVEQAKALRFAIAGHETNRRDGYYALASFLGHAQPDLTMASYLHCAGRLLFNKLSVCIDNKTYKALSQHTGIRLDSLKRSIGYVALNGRIKKLLKPTFLVVLPKQKESRVSEASASLNFAASLTLFSTWQALEAIERGYTVEQVSSLFGVNRVTVERRLVNARYLHNVRTRENVSRLFSQARLRKVGPDKERKELLVPYLAKSKAELKNLEGMVLKLRSKARAQGGKRTEFNQSLKTWAWEIVNRVSSTQSHITFDNPKIALQIIKMLEGVVPKSRMSFELHYPKNLSKEAVLGAWQQFLPKGVKAKLVQVDSSEGTIEDIYLWFRVKHPSRKDILSRNISLSDYSTNSVAVLAHMLLIVMGIA